MASFWWEHTFFFVNVIEKFAEGFKTILIKIKLPERKNLRKTWYFQVQKRQKIREKNAVSLSIQKTYLK